MKPWCRDTLHNNLWSKLPFDFSVCPRKSLGPASRANVRGDAVQAQDAAPEGWARQLSLVLVRRLQGSWGQAPRGWTHRARPGRAPSVRADAASVLLYARASPGPSWQLGLSLVFLPLWTPRPECVLLGTPLTLFSLAGGTPKPEPEQVIKKYTEELKAAPDEACVGGAVLLLVCFADEGRLRRRVAAFSLLGGH